MITEERRLMRLKRLKRELKNEEAALENAGGTKKLSIESRIVELQGMVARTEIPKVEIPKYPIMLPEETVTVDEEKNAHKHQMGGDDPEAEHDQQLSGPYPKVRVKRSKKGGKKLFEIKDQS